MHSIKLYLSLTGSFKVSKILKKDTVEDQKDVQEYDSKDYFRYDQYFLRMVNLW